MTALGAFALSACAAFPELDATVTDEMRQAEFPTLAPISELQAPAGEQRLTDAALSELAARASALKLRAARLKRTIVGAETRRRMRAGVSLPEPSEG